jgi:hypothetical protein
MPARPYPTRLPGPDPVPYHAGLKMGRKSWRFMKADLMAWLREKELTDRPMVSTIMVGGSGHHGANPGSLFLTTNVHQSQADFHLLLPLSGQPALGALPPPRSPATGPQRPPWGGCHPRPQPHPWLP